MGNAVGGLRRCYMVLVAAAVMAVGLGFAYLLLLRLFAKPLVYAALTILIVGSLAAGAFFFAGEVLTGEQLLKWKAANMFYTKFDATQARTYSLAAGGVCSAVGLVFLIVVFC